VIIPHRGEKITSGKGGRKIPSLVEKRRRKSPPKKKTLNIDLEGKGNGGGGAL